MTRQVLLIDRCLAVDTRCTAHSIASPRDLRDWVLESGRRYQSLCNNAAVSGFRF